LSEERTALVRYRLEQADEALEGAQLLLDAGKCRRSVSESYYAMFYSVLALLAAEGRQASKHAWAIAEFDRGFVKKGVFDKELSFWLHDSFDQRLLADYKPLTEVSPARSQAILDRARAFVRTVRGHLAATGWCT
jgi:uncharacterized protein (UPF0332 family)